MKLTELGLQAFGKFHQRSIAVADGLNLICGENETGKSTIHRFIRGMLFGFKKEHSQRRYYTPEHDRYRPWSGPDYRGRLEYQLDDGQRIAIERCFQTDTTRIYDAVTGKSLESNFDMDPRKEYSFAQKHLGINATVFDHTIFLAQLGGKTGKELAVEVADRLSRLSQSGREDLSVKEALAVLRKKRDDLGTVRAVSKPLGKAVRNWEDLGSEQSEMEHLHHSLRMQMEELNDALTRRQDLAEKIRRVKEHLEAAQTAKNRYDAARVLGYWNEQQDILTEMSQIEDYADFPDSLKPRLQEILTKADTLQEAVGSVQLRMEERSAEEEALKQKMGRFPADIPFHEKARQDILLRFAEIENQKRLLHGLDQEIGKAEQDIQTLNELIGQRPNLKKAAEIVTPMEAVLDEQDQLLRSSLPADLDRLKQKGREVIRRMNLQAGGALVAALIGISTALMRNPGLSVPWDGWTVAALGAAVAATAGALAVGLRKRQHRILHGSLIRQMTEEIHQNQQRAAAIQESVDEILAELKAKSLREVQELALSYRGFQDRLQDLSQHKKDREGKYREQQTDMERNERILLSDLARVTPDLDHRGLCRDHVDRYLNRLQEMDLWAEEHQRVRRAGVALQEDAVRLQEQIQALETERMDIFKAAGVADRDQFMEGCHKKEEYRHLQERYNQLKHLLEPYLARFSLEQWRDYMTVEPPEAIPVDYEERWITWIRQEKEWTDLLQKTEVRIAALEADMARALEGRRSLSEITEDLDRAFREKKMQEIEAAALDTALEVLASAADRRHRLLAPELNHRVEGIIRRITHERYKKVRIDEEMKITVTEPEGGRSVDLEMLSAGTVDQFYFAVRIAMADLLSGDRKLPLILDDPFVQYSPHRLQQTMSLLGELAADRQILLFTSGKREAEELGSMNIPYNRICLDQLPAI